MSNSCKNVYCADYIIIGAGAAGAVLAERLTEDRETSVILLEAGQDEDNNPIITAPTANIDQDTYGPAFFWPGNTLPSPDAGDRVFDWSNGRLAGGGTSIFGMIYVRGTKERFDEWTPLVGPEWTGEKVFQAYKEMENFNGPFPDRGHHGRTVARYGISDSNSTQSFMTSVQNTGVPGSNILIEDYNNPDQPIGVFSSWQYWQFPDQTRGSSSRTYLTKKNPYLSRILDDKLLGVNGRKLKLVTQTTATHLLWSDSKKNKVKGVYAVNKGLPVLYKANKKVILSAGFKSSGFLQVNGIGPRDVLEAAGVKVRVDLPGVGINLRNNPYILGTILIPPSTVTTNTQPGSFQTMGEFLPDPRPGKGLDRRIEINAEFQLDLLGAGTGLQAIILIQPLRLKSRGTIKIQDADPLKIEAAQFAYLSDPDDLDFIQAIFSQILVPMVTYLQNNAGYIAAYPTLAQLEDPSYVTSYIQNNVGNTHHYQCFNKMGPVSDNGVVDVWGNVHGVKGLMNVDDGIAPVSTDGNTGLTAEMLAYRIANHLLGKK